MTNKGKLSRTKWYTLECCIMTHGNFTHIWWINYIKKATAKILCNLAVDTHEFATKLSEMFATISLSSLANDPC